MVNKINTTQAKAQTAILNILKPKPKNWFF